MPYRIDPTVSGYLEDVVSGKCDEDNLKALSNLESFIVLLSDFI